MDYKYIEQLLERYWNCETSIEEEQILRAFFHQENLPSNLIQFKPLFVYQEVEKNISLGDDFDKNILKLIEKPVVKAQKLTIYKRFSPLFKAAAMLMLLLSVGAILQNTMDKDNSLIYVYDQYKGNSSDPQVAYDSNLPIDSINNIVSDHEKSVVENN